MHRLCKATTFLSILFLTTAGVGAAQAKPRALPVEPVKDFDVVAQGEVIHHEFEIKNDGATPLKITDVRPACGCTVVKYDKVIAPGAIGKIKAKVATDTFGGPIAKSIAVFTNDPENPKLQLVVKAKIQPYIAAVPGFARYNYVQGEPVEPITQIIWAADGTEMKIVDVISPYDYVKVAYREATEEERNENGTGRQYRLDVQLDPDAPIGALRQYVEVKLDHPKQQLVKIPITGFVRPRQHLTPAEVNFGELESLQLERTIHFTNFITDGIELTGIETGIEGMKALVVPNEEQPGHRFKLILTASPEMPKGEFATTVKIHINDRQNPVIELPVKGTVL